MQVNQEIDALKTLGLHPAELLVLPRVIALTLTLPLLTLYANIMALLGGALMCWLQLDISFGPFLRQLQEAIGLWTLWVGLIKAPVFAFVIAVVGCYQGFRVSGSAESVGQLTTRSVVHAIFLVILLDAVFSVLFAWLEI
jgi:phospholipid/cholesterol/gamma-HCH transport system permease protein